MKWHYLPKVRRPVGHYRAVLGAMGATAVLGFAMLLASVYAPAWTLGLIGMSSDSLVRALLIMAYPVLFLQLVSSLGLMTFLFVWSDKTHGIIVRTATAMEMAGAPVFAIMTVVAAAHYWDTGWTPDVMLAILPVIGGGLLNVSSRCFLTDDVIKGGLLLRGFFFPRWISLGFAHAASDFTVAILSGTVGAVRPRLRVSGAFCCSMPLTLKPCGQGEWHGAMNAPLRQGLMNAVRLAHVLIGKRSTRCAIRNWKNVRPDYPRSRLRSLRGWEGSLREGAKGLPS